MTYAETLDFLFTQLPMYQRQGAPAMKKNLGNIRKLLDALGKPERRMGKIIHVAGTNGKGTTTHLLAAALQAQGHRVGVYTSPHYRDFRERMKINGDYISEAEVVDFVAANRELIDRVEPSFFEITVAMAFDFFARSRVQWSVVEVGLGGRLDSTNVVTPVLSVITNIGLDHTQFLGETHAEIAGEKSGIIKPGIPVVIGERDERTEPVFRRVAGERGAPIYFADEEVSSPSASKSTLRTRASRPMVELERMNLGGPHLPTNTRTALAALATLDQHEYISLADGDWAAGFYRVKELTNFIGRWEELPGYPVAVIADSAHNEHGLTGVLNQLRESYSPQLLHFVLGFVSDKDVRKVLGLFPKEATYHWVRADIPRALPVEELATMGEEAGLRGAVRGSVQQGLRAAVAAAERTNGTVYVGGSIFVVAEVI